MKNTSLFEEFALNVLRTFVDAEFGTFHGRRCYKHGRFVFTELADGKVAVKADSFNKIFDSIDDIMLVAHIAHGLRK